MTFQTNIPETLVVTRDGELDESYYDAIYAQKRREALQNAGKEALRAAVHAPIAVGKGIVWLMTHDTVQA